MWAPQVLRAGHLRLEGSLDRSSVPSPRTEFGSVLIVRRSHDELNTVSTHPRYFRCQIGKHRLRHSSHSSHSRHSTKHCSFVIQANRLTTGKLIILRTSGRCSSTRRFWSRLSAPDELRRALRQRKLLGFHAIEDNKRISIRALVVQTVSRAISLSCGTYVPDDSVCHASFAYASKAPNKKVRLGNSAVNLDHV